MVELSTNFHRPTLVGVPELRTQCLVRDTHPGLTQWTFIEFYYLCLTRNPPFGQELISSFVLVLVCCLLLSFFVLTFIVPYTSGPVYL